MISLEKAKNTKLFYFVVTGVIYRESDKRCLILKRSDKEVTHPGLWSIVGGKLEWSDLNEKDITRWNHDVPNWEGIAERLLYRETKEECGLDVYEPIYLSSIAFVRPDNVPVVCIKFGVRYKKGKVILAPEFDEYAWVDTEEIKQYSIIKGIDQEIEETIKTFSKS